ncbi:hypothetical protein LSAT2_024833 [Lamellibrachia satsuma]|nr:hypothetical protein LSAT2_024833 [Lamellibrachia satsuma]
MRHYLRTKRHTPSSVGDVGLGRPGYFRTSLGTPNDRGRTTSRLVVAGGEPELRKTSVWFTIVAIFAMLTAVFWLSYVLRSSYATN